MIRRKTIPAIRKARRPSPARSGARSDQRRPRPAAWATRPAMIKASAPAPPIHPSGRPMNTRVAAIAPRSPPHTRRQAPEDRAAAPMPIGSARIRHWAVNAGSPSVVPPRFGGKSEESDEPCWPDRKICRREPSAARAAAIRKERNTSRTAAASLRQRIVQTPERQPHVHGANAGDGRTGQEDDRQGHHGGCDPCGLLRGPSQRRDGSQEDRGGKDHRALREAEGIGQAGAVDERHHEGDRHEGPRREAVGDVGAVGLRHAEVPPGMVTKAAVGADEP